MTERKSAAERSQPKPGTKGSRQTASQKAAAIANTAKGREKRERMREEARARGADSATERWAKLLDGTLTVSDLDEEELARMTVRSKDGSFAGSRRAVPSHLIAAMRKEALKRATDMFQTAVPKAVNRLMEMIEDPETSDANLLRAMDILFNRGLGRMPETIRVETADKWDEALDAAYAPGVDRAMVSDEDE